MEEISIRDYIAIINKWKVVIILVTIIFALTSFMVSKFIIKPQYSAESTLIVGNSKIDTKNQVDINDLMTYDKLVTTYAKVIQSKTVLSDVKNKLRYNIGIDALNNMIIVTPQQDTQLINIKVKNQSPKRAAEIANQVGRSFINKITEIMKIEQNVHVVDKAGVPKAPASPNVILNTIIAAFLGIMVSFAFAFLIEFLDDTVKTPDDVEKYLGLPVIGTIPMVTEQLIAKGGKHSNA